MCNLQEWLVVPSKLNLVALYKCLGKKNRAYEKNIKKVEHKFEKSVKMELTKNQNGGQNYALHLFYRKTNRIARHNNK